MIRYCQRFVPHAARLLGPLIDILAEKLKAEKKLVWTSHNKAMFNKTKNILYLALL